MNTGKALDEVPLSEMSLATAPMSTPGESGGSGSKTVWTVLVIATVCVVGATGCLLVLRHLFPPSAAWPQGWYNSFDAGIVKFFNQFAHRWHGFDIAVHDVEEYNLLKAAPIVTLLWVAFFLKGGGTREIQDRQSKVLATVPLAIFGVVLARILAVVLPFRERPFRTVALHFQLPYGIKHGTLYGWSSFPSDHLVLFTALIVGLLMASRLVGSIALVYGFFFILLPRLYLGFHWPTDLLAGAAIGAALANIVRIDAYRNFVWRISTNCWRRWPGLCAAFAFLLSYEIVDLFATPIDLVETILHHHF
jgi:membrane-associated phospholipid phosphatase